MPRPFGSTIALDTQTRSELEALVRAGSTPQALALRCNVVLAAAEPGNPSNLDVAAGLGCDRHTAAKWRERFAAHGLAGLQDAPRSGRPRSFSPRRGHRRHRDGQRQDRRA
jgi:transposase